MWLFCQFATEMTFSLWRNAYLLHLIPALLWVNSALLSGWMLWAGPVTGWVAVSYLLGRKKKRHGFFIAGTLMFNVFLV